MASSSLSQDDIDHEYEVHCSRRSRIRTARSTRNVVATMRETLDGDLCSPSVADAPVGGPQEHDASPKPCSRVKDKRCPRPNHATKAKAQRERRKLREKRRSTGVMHLQSTESTGGSTAEEEEEPPSTDTRRNAPLDEAPLENPGEEEAVGRTYPVRSNKSPSDLDADDEDNQDYDSAVNRSDSTTSLARDGAPGRATLPANGRPQTPCSERAEELLERAREENCRLLDLLKEKDARIHALERKVIALGKELGDLATENRDLREPSATDSLAKAAAK